MADLDPHVLPPASSGLDELIFKETNNHHRITEQKQLAVSFGYLAGSIVIVSFVADADFVNAFEMNDWLALWMLFLLGIPLMFVTLLYRGWKKYYIFVERKLVQRMAEAAGMAAQLAEADWVPFFWRPPGDNPKRLTVDSVVSNIPTILCGSFLLLVGWGGLRLSSTGRLPSCWVLLLLGAAVALYLGTFLYSRVRARSFPTG